MRKSVVYLGDVVVNPAPHLAVRDCGLNPRVWTHLQGEKGGCAKGFGEIWPESRGTLCNFARAAKSEILIS